MNLKNFKQAYLQTISESANDSDLKNYIRSIVENELKEAVNPKTTTTSELIEVMRIKGWKLINHPKFPTYYVFLKGYSVILISKKQDKDGGVNWSNGEAEYKIDPATIKINIFGSGNDSLADGIKIVKRIASGKSID
jgi:hypothetical protein